LRQETEADSKIDINPQVKVTLKGSKIDENKNIKYKTKVRILKIFRLILGNQ